jgi:aminoglycoside phosphotransferase (APT) family kinase protein
LSTNAGSASLPVPGVDLERLSAWMDAQGLPPGAIGRVERLGGGTQNILLRFERGGRAYVLRRPPLHKRANSDETMLREARVLRALAGTDVPHPGLVAVCDDPSVIGAAFFLMEPVDGTVIGEAVAALSTEHPDAAHAIGLSMADGAASMANVDIDAVGLGDFGRADGWLARQVGRWRSQLEGYARIEGYEGAAIDNVDEVASWLDERTPDSFVPGLIHGDFHFGNVMIARDAPVLAAIVDWELATIGDPQLDLAHLFATWPDGREGEAVSPTIPGLPSREELFDRYRQGTTRDLSHFDWYRVLACYRLGIILEGTKARADGGLAPRETGDHLHEVALSLFRQAGRLIDDAR